MHACNQFSTGLLYQHIFYFICDYKWRLFLINTYCMQRKKDQNRRVEKKITSDAGVQTNLKKISRVSVCFSSWSHTSCVHTLNKHCTILLLGLCVRVRVFAVFHNLWIISTKNRPYAQINRITIEYTYNYARWVMCMKFILWTLEAYSSRKGSKVKHKYVLCCCCCCCCLYGKKWKTISAHSTFRIAFIWYFVFPSIPFSFPSSSNQFKFLIHINTVICSQKSKWKQQIYTCKW